MRYVDVSSNLQVDIFSSNKRVRYEKVFSVQNLCLNVGNAVKKTE